MSVVNTVNNFAAMQYQGVMQSTGAQSDAFSKSAASVGLAPEATKAATTNTILVAGTATG